jgi:hypothetical protein
MLTVILWGIAFALSLVSFLLNMRKVLMSDKRKYVICFTISMFALWWSSAMFISLLWFNNYI